MERGRDQAENDRNAPDDVIGARQVENVSAEPRAEKRTELWLKNTNPNSVESTARRRFGRRGHW